MGEIQRRRTLAAALDAVTELGYTRTTVEQVTNRAKVSRKTFYDVLTRLARLDPIESLGEGRDKGAANA
jgi:DNA-directed RNA polymerase specialized sigma54-like protein